MLYEYSIYSVISQCPNNHVFYRPYSIVTARNWYDETITLYTLFFIHEPCEIATGTMYFIPLKANVLTITQYVFYRPYSIVSARNWYAEAITL